MIRLSRSLAVGANKKVRPLIEVSDGKPTVFSEFKVCRSTIVKLKMSSSSFERRKRKDGGCEGLFSGS